MFRALAAFFLAMLSSVAAASAGPAQSLGIDVSGATPRLDKLVEYVESTPVVVRVTAPNAQRVAIIGVSPSGVNIRVPLAHGPGQAFTGTLTLETAGTWKLAVDATVEGGDAMTGTFAIEVARGTQRDATLLFALAGLSICSGLGLIAVVRARSHRVNT
jgi:hypothetical protein